MNSSKFRPLVEGYPFEMGAEGEFTRLVVNVPDWDMAHAIVTPIAQGIAQAHQLLLGVHADIHIAYHGDEISATEAAAATITQRRWQDGGHESIVLAELYARIAWTVGMTVEAQTIPAAPLWIMDVVGNGLYADLVDADGNLYPRTAVNELTCCQPQVVRPESRESRVEENHDYTLLPLTSAFFDGQEAEHLRANAVFETVREVAGIPLGTWCFCDGLPYNIIGNYGGQDERLVPVDFNPELAGMSMSAWDVARVGKQGRYALPMSALKVVTDRW